MPKNVTQYELLISCPGDIKEEVHIIEDAVNKFNAQFSRTLHVSIQTRYWEKDSYPASGDKPQNILNKQFVNDCDAAVAIFWTRFGTPTDEYGSGTEEEIENMLRNNKQVFLYFSDRSINPSLVNNEQYKKVQQFKKKYENKGLYCSYSRIDEFEDIFFAHLTQYFLSLSNKQERGRKPDLTIALLDAKTKKSVEQPYVLKMPTEAIMRRELCEEDIIEEISEYVTPDDIYHYNAALPPKDEVDEYNRQQRLYENSQKNRHDFILSLNNNGNAKANDIYVELEFPEGILVYDTDDAEQIKAPRQKPDMPNNPILSAFDKIDEKEMREQCDDLSNIMDLNMNYCEFANAVNNIHAVQLRNDETISIALPSSYDYSIDDEHKKLSMHLKDLLHTRSYSSDEFCLIFMTAGEFEIGYSVMCEEWTQEVRGKFLITANW